jgi:hypothetical protein
MWLMADHAFGLGYRRYEWKCDALNAPSRRAAERLGFTYEGTFRQALVVKGRNRDTAWFSGPAPLALLPHGAGAACWDVVLRIWDTRHTGLTGAAAPENVTPCVSISLYVPGASAEPSQHTRRPPSAHRAGGFFVEQAPAVNH